MDGPYNVTRLTSEKGCFDHRSERMCVRVCSAHSAAFVCNRVGLTAGTDAHCHIPSAQHQADSVGLICWLNK